jgi:PAS domain S-box-containing protein
LNANSEVFTFIPATLVQGDYDSLHLPENVIRELFFVRAIEGDLLATAQGMDGISQVYFISFSGFVSIRLPHLSREENSDHFQDKFRPVMCFSDRNYFHNVMRANEDDFFEVTEPYIDTAGSGLVRTYSAYVHNRNLNVIGMIGFDQAIELDPSFWTKKGPMSNAFRDLEFDNHVIQSSSNSDQGSPRDIGVARALSQVDSNKELALSGIRRWPVDEGRELFTFPLGPQESDQVGYFVFDPVKAATTYNWWFVVYIVSIVCILCMLALLLVFRQSSVESERLQTGIISNLHGGFLITSRSGVVRTCNEKFCGIVKADGVVGRDLDEFFSTESINEYRQKLRKSGGDANRGFEFTADLKAVDGVRVPAIVTCAAIDYQGRPSIMIIAIPSRDLELTIASRFLLHFSHALKTPVHSILLIADRLRRKKVQVKFDYYFSLMRKQVDEFNIMVNNILEFSHKEIESKDLNKKPVNVAQLLRTALSAVNDRARASEIELKTSIPENLRVKVDENKFRVIFNNLIDNALKYSEEGSYISVHASDLGTEVRIVFTDSGIGVEKEDRDHIFDRFYRGSSDKVREREGLGMGLYISKQFAVAHGGDLVYEPLLENSEPGSEASSGVSEVYGSKFIITIPKDL